MTITLRFVGGSSFIDDAVKFGEGGGWADHVDVLMPDGTLLGALPDGVKARPRDYDKDEFDRELYVTLLPRAWVVPGQSTAAFYEYLQSMVGKKYDWEAIVGIAFRETWHSKEADGAICSGLVVTALQHAGFLPERLYVPPSMVTPRDLLLIVSTRQQLEGPE